MKAPLPNVFGRIASPGRLSARQIRPGVPFASDDGNIYLKVSWAPWLSLAERSITLGIGLWLALALTFSSRAWAQTNCNCPAPGQTITANTLAGYDQNNANPLCINLPGSGGAYTFNQGITYNGNTLCIATGVTFAPSTASYNGSNLVITNNGTYQGPTLNLTAGRVFHNYGTFSGAVNLDGGRIFNYPGASLNITGGTNNSGRIVNLAGGSLVWSGSGTLRLNNNLRLDNAGNGRLAFSNVNWETITDTIRGNLTVAGNVSNDLPTGQTLWLSGMLRVEGNYQQGNNATVASLTGAGCAALSATGNIQGRGFYNGTAGPGLALSTTLNPSCPSCLSGTVTTTMPGNPNNQVTLSATLTASANYRNISGSIQAYTQGATQATHYIVVRRLGAAPGAAETPQPLGTYTVGQRLGAGTIVAINPIGTTGWTDFGILAQNGCLSNYQYAAFALNGTFGGTACGGGVNTSAPTVRTFTNVNAVAGTVTPTPSGTTVCAGATPALALSGHTGRIIRWEVGPAGFATSTPIAGSDSLASIIAPAFTTAAPAVRAVVTTGPGCTNATPSQTFTVNTPPTVNVGPAMAATCAGVASAPLGGSVSAGATASWSSTPSGGAFTNSTQPNTTFTGTAANTYTLTLTAIIAGCSNATATKTIVVQAPATVSAGAAMVAQCTNSSSVALGGSVGGGATGSTWTITAAPGGHTATLTNANDPANATFNSGTVAGTYTLTLTATGSVCGTPTATKNIVVNAPPTANAGAAIGPLCTTTGNTTLGGSISAGATAAWTVSPTASTTLTNTTSAANGTFAAIATGTYTVTLTASIAGCANATASKNIVVNAPATLNVGPAMASMCPGQTSLALGGSVSGGATTGVWNISAAPGGSTATLTNATNAAAATFSSGAVAGTYTVRLVADAVAGCAAPAAVTKNIAVVAFPVVAAITGPQVTCVGGTTPFANTTAGGTWASDNVAVATVNSSGLVTGVSAGTANITYTVTTSGCPTTVSRAVTIVTTPQGTEGQPGNGQWNAYVYNGTTISTANYAGWFAGPAALGFNTNSAAIYPATVAPSTNSAYQGCQVSATNYAVRFLRTGFAPGVYSIAINADDQGIFFLDGQQILSATASTLNWTGSLTPTSVVEMRHLNASGNGNLNFAIALVAAPTMPTPGSITGGMGICATDNLAVALTSTANPGAGSCTGLTPLVQWESSTDKATWAPIAGATGNAYTVPAGLAQTTYFRRALRTWCGIYYTNTDSVVVSNGPQGDPAAYPTNQWNAYVYSSTGFGNLGTYFGYFTEPQTNVNTFNQATVGGYVSGASPSMAGTYQGCLAPASNLGISFKRTGFAPGAYRINLPNHDDGVELYIDGTLAYSLNGCCQDRGIIWTGQLTAASQVEVRLFQGGGGSGINFTLTPYTLQASDSLQPATISRSQSICTGQVPQWPLTITTPATSGCSIRGYQWQISTDNIVFTDIAGATNATYSIPSNLTENTWFRQVVTDWCGATKVSNVIVITIDNTTPGDPSIWPAGRWNAYSFAGNNYQDYAGFFPVNSLSFISTDFYGTTQSPSFAPGYGGCQIPPVNHSVIYRRVGAPALPAGQVYRIDVTQLDDQGALLIDSQQVWSANCCIAPLTPATGVWTGPIDATTNLEVRHRAFGSPNSIGLTFTAVPRPTSVNPGAIAGSTTICSGDIPMAGFSNATLPSNGCSVDYYRWQISTDAGATWLDLPNSNSASFTPVQSIYGAPGAQTLFRRRVFDLCGNVAATAPVVVTIQNTVPGNPATFGTNTWNVYAYDDPNFALYVGFYTEDNLAFNTRTRYAATLPPSAAGTTASGQGFVGCQQTNTQWSASARRRGLGTNPAGYYRFNINWHDDNITFLVNGQQVFQHIGCCDSHADVWTGYVDNTTTLEWRWVNFPGPGGLDFTAVYLGTTPPTNLRPGTLQTSQLSFCPGDPVNVYSDSAAYNACYPQYQWQRWDGTAWQNVSGGTSEDLLNQPSITDSATYRRGATDICGNAMVYTAPITVRASSNTPPTLLPNRWTVMLYNSNDYTSNYAGFYTEDNVDINTTLRHGNSAPPSQANALTGQAYTGCLTNSTNYTVRYVRTGFPAGRYSIDILGHDDDVILLVNGVEVYRHLGCCDAHAGVWLGDLGAASTVEFRYRNGGGPGNLHAVFAPAVAPIPLSPGTIAAAQSSVCAGSPATINQATAASGSCTVANFQWQQSPDGSSWADIAGATLANYTSGPLAAATWFRRQDIDACGATAFTNAVQVTLLPAVSAPVIGANQAICAGATPAALTVPTAASGGNGTFSYRWEVSTDSITFSPTGSASATPQSLALPALSSPRWYRLGVTACGGTVYSNVVRVRINPNTAITAQPQNWTGCSGAQAVFTVGANGTNLTYQWQLSTNSGSTWANITSGAAGESGWATSTLTVNIPAPIPANTRRYRVIVSGACGTNPATSGQANLNLGAPTMRTQPTNASACVGATATFAAAGTGATLFQWQTFRSGAWRNVANAGAYSGANTGTLTINPVQDTLNGRQFQCILTNGCAGSTTSTAATLSTNQPIANNTVPATFTLCALGTGTPLGASTPSGGSGSYTYQWERSLVGPSSGFVAMAGQTGLDYTPAGWAQNVWVRRVVTSGGCTSTSNATAITVAPTFAINTQPVSATVCPSGTATFSVDVTGSAVTYQWQDSTGASGWNNANGGVYSGQNTPTLTVTNPGLGRDGHRFRVLITGTGSCTGTTVTSRSARLTTAGVLPTITLQPAATTNWCTASPATIPMAATGTGLTYQWQLRQPGGSFVNLINGAIYNGVATNTLTILNPSAVYQGYEYRVVVNNSCGVPVTSNSSFYNQVSAIANNSVSSPQNLCAGSVPVGLVGSTPTGGSGTYVYQWQMAPASTGTWANIAGATGINYNPPALNETTQFRRLVTSTGTNCATSISLAINLSVDQPPTVAPLPANTGTCAGTSVNIAATATGNNISYQWQVSTNNGASWANVANGSQYANATTATMRINGTPAGFNGYLYRVLVTGDCGGVANSVVTSTATTLVVNPGATITAEPANRTICANGSTTYTFSYTLPAPGTLPLTFQWQERIGGGGYANISNGGTFSGVTTQTLTLTAVPASWNNNRRYRCVVTYGGCPVFTSAGQGTLTVQPLPTLALTATANPICVGQSTTLNIGGATTYSWSTGSTANAITVSPTASTVYSVTGTNTATGCQNTASLTVTVNPLVTPAVSISTAATTICAGTTATFTATPTNGGASPVYQWRINGNPVGTNSPTFATSALANGDVVTCRLTSNATCASPAQATSSGITMAVTPTVQAPTAIAGPAELCQATASTDFTATVGGVYTSLTWSVTAGAGTATGTGTTGTISWNPAFTGTATVSAVANGCGGASAARTFDVRVIPSGTWLGTTADWNNPANWCGGVPTLTSTVLIPAGVPNMPAVSANAATGALTIQPGAGLTLTGTSVLTIAGSVSQLGTFAPGAASTVAYTATAAQAVVPANYGHLTLSGGPKVLTGTVRISGDFTAAASSYTVAGSTIEFNGTAAQTVPAFTFNNLTVSGGSTKTMDGNVTVNGGLNLTAGKLALGANTLAINGPIGGTGTLVPACASTLSIGGAGATGTLRFDPAAQDLGTLAMAKASAGNVALGNNVNICTSLQLTQGNILLGGNTLTVLPGATLSGGSANSYIVTPDQVSPTGAGFLVQRLATGAGQRLFPVGTAGSYTPALMANVGTSRDMRVRVFNNVYENGIAGPAIQNLEASVKKTWEIEPLPGAGTPDVAITLQWNPADEGTFFAGARVNRLAYIGKNTGVGNSPWVKQTVSALQVTTAPYRIATPSITSFSKFAIGSEMTPLPVTMGDLTVDADKAHNVLHWSTYAEIESRGFEVLRSADGQRFEKIAFVEGAGNSQTVRQYSHQDVARPGRTYYKIRFVGRAEGDEAFSNTVQVVGTAEQPFSVYPNPATDILYLEGADEEATFTLTDLKGTQFYLDTRRKAPGALRVDIRHLPQGVYVLEKRDANGRATVRVVKQ